MGRDCDGQEGSLKRSSFNAYSIFKYVCVYICMARVFLGSETSLISVDASFF